MFYVLSLQCPDSDGDRDDRDSKVLKHIGLEIDESDLEDFYRDLLNLEITGRGLITKEMAEQLFGIPQSVDVRYAKGEGYELELFICQNTLSPSFRHFCIHTDRAGTIYDLSLKKGYHAVIHKNRDRESYFIKDRNGNTFELKSR
jgi:hypothetical protein